jgi:DNA repair exonuclease SbcCD ATPase subunit
VNRKTGKDCQTRSVWEEGDGSRYVVTRWRKKNVGGKRSGVSLEHHSKSGTVTDLTKGTDKLTQVEIDKALGCSKEVFTAAVYAGQEKLPNLPSMTDTELKLLIEKASGVDVLVAAYRIARDKLLDAERAHDTWRADHVRSERDVTDAQARLTQITTQRDEYDGRRRAEVAVLRSQVQDAVQRAKLKKAERDGIDPVRIQKEVDACDAKINSVTAERTEDERLSSILLDVTARRTSAQANYDNAVRQVTAQKAKFDGVADQVGKPCDECGKPYEEHDVEGAKKIAADLLRGFITNANEHKLDVNELDTEVATASQKLAQHRNARTDISATVEERKRFAELLAVRKRAEEGLATETATATRINEQFVAKQAESNPFLSLVTGATTEFEEAAEAFRASEILGVEVEKRCLVCKDVVKVFGPAGVRAHILDNVTPFLNDRTADYLGFMSDGNISAVWSTLSLNAKGEMVEKFAINVQKNGGSFAGLSGGEKRKVRLATALALQDLVASRAMKPIELFIGDELDDALDPNGLERLMGVLEKKARERGTLLIISHSDISDWCRNVCTVTMKDEMATIDGGILAVL